MPLESWEGAFSPIDDFLYKNPFCFHSSTPGDFDRAKRSHGRFEDQQTVTLVKTGLEHLDVSKNRGKTPKMDGENKGKPYFLMDDLGGKPHYFRKHPFGLVVMNGCDENS